MSTHAQGTGTRGSGRWFDIKVQRDSTGATGKDSKAGPAFFEAVKELPAQIPQGVKTEIRGDLKFLIYEGISGYLTNLYTREVTVEGKSKPVKYLNIVLADAEGQYNISTGSIDERYSTQLLKRLLDPNFDPSKVLYVGMYMIEDKEGGKPNKGISAKSGDIKLKAAKGDAHLANCPPVKVIEVEGQEDVKSYWPIVNWLMTELAKKLPADVLTKPVGKSDETPAAAPAVPAAPQAAPPKINVNIPDTAPPVQQAENNAPEDSDTGLSF